MTVQRHSADNGSTSGYDSGQAAVPSIPLSADSPAMRGGPADNQSIGGLVRDASTHLSTLVRAEVELAKSEVAAEVKKAVKGSVFFIVALVILLFSLFYLFFTLAELLWEFGLARWAAFGIVFLVMLLMTGLFGFLGYRKVRKIRAPQRTISSAKETVAALKNRGGDEQAERQPAS